MKVTELKLLRSMGLGQKFGGKNRGKHGKERKKRAPAQDYGDIEMKNESFEAYYKGVGVMDEKVDSSLPKTASKLRFLRIITS